MMTPEGSDSFETFGASHWVAIGAVVLLGAGLPVLVRAARSQRLTRVVAWGLAAVLLGSEAVYLWQSWITQSPTEFVQKALPLHICGIGIFLTVWVLLAPRQLLYEVAFFWGLAGTVQAILTPSLSDDFPSTWYFTYFINHGAIVVGVLFATVAMGLRPKRGAMLRIAVITNVYLLCVAGANWLLGANYMFLSEPPHGDSPFFFLPWPWYIVMLEGVGLGLMMIVYMPFWLSRTFGGRKQRARLQDRQD